MSEIALKQINELRVELRFKRLNETAHSPTRISENAFALRAAEPTEIAARGRGLVSTALSFELPRGSYAQLLPRRELLADHFVDLGAGVIDCDYRGEVKVLLINHGETPFVVAAGAAVAEAAVCLCPATSALEAGELRETARAAQGFGSSGLQ